MSRVLVFGWAGRSAVALATDLTALGLDSWATSDPQMAADLVRQHRQITCAVVDCCHESKAVCERLRFRRPDLRILGLSADGGMVCGVDCRRFTSRDAMTLLPALRESAR